MADNPSTAAYADYDTFAGIYSQHWGPREGGQALPRLQRRCLHHVAPGAQVLDLCCGAGNLAAQLIEHGYRVTGVDGSRELLRHASELAPAAQFVLADARQFMLDERVDAALCVSDSLNHLMTLDELGQVFVRVFAVLNDNALFHFDLNRRIKYEQAWNDTIGIVRDDEVCIAQASYDAQERVAALKATIFEKQADQWHRKDAVLLQTHYPEQAIVDVLHKAGFSDVEVSYSGNNDPEAAYKAYFTCWKRG